MWEDVVRQHVNGEVGSLGTPCGPFCWSWSHSWKHAETAHLMNLRHATLCVFGLTFTDFGPSCGPAHASLQAPSKRVVTSWACWTSTTFCDQHHIFERSRYQKQQQSSDLAWVMLNESFLPKFKWSYVILLFVSRLAVAKTWSPHI